MIVPLVASLLAFLGMLLAIPIWYCEYQRARHQRQAHVKKNLSKERVLAIQDEIRQRLQACMKEQPCAQGEDSSYGDTSSLPQSVDEEASPGQEAEAEEAEAEEEEAEDEETCAICLLPFEDDEAIAQSSSCPHTFHYDCLQSWFLSSAKRQVKRDNSRIQLDCPTCRQIFAGCIAIKEKKGCETGDIEMGINNRS